MCVCMSVCVCLSVCVSVCVCLYVYMYVCMYHSLEIFARKYFVDNKFKVKYFRGYMTSSKCFYLEHISLVIIHTD